MPNSYTNSVVPFRGKTCLYAGSRGSGSHFTERFLQDILDAPKASYQVAAVISTIQIPDMKSRSFGVAFCLDVLCTGDWDSTYPRKERNFVPVNVQRMEKWRLPNEVMKWRPPRRRKRGRPKLTWAEGITGLMGEKGLMAEDWNYRSNWKKKII